MKLEQFKQIADENLKDLTADERMVSRIRQQTLLLEKKPQPRVPRFAVYAAAACAAVMLLSGGILAATGLPGANANSGIKARAGITVGQKAAPTALSSNMETSAFIDGSTLPYGISEIGQYSEGFAPASSTAGLFGYVNEDSVWVVKAVYDEVGAVENGEAKVKFNGQEQIISVP